MAIVHQHFAVQNGVGDAPCHFAANGLKNALFWSSLVKFSAKNDAA
jgi:hypothetical protein